MILQLHTFAFLKKLIFLSSVSVAMLSSSPVQKRDSPDYKYASKIWYSKPSVNWNEALPIGNGRMGAMIFGGVLRERISLNEQTLWSGAPYNGNNPNAKRYLPLVRAAALAGEYKKADSLSKFMQGPYTESYMPMADLMIEYNAISDSASYKRELDFDSAITTTSFTNNNTTHVRSAFASFPDQVIVIRNSANKKRAISFHTQLTSKLHYKIVVVSANHIILKGKCPKHVEPVYRWQLKNDVAVQYAADDSGEGMNFEVHLLIKNENGKIQSDENGITVAGADAVTFIISAATSFNGYDKSPGLEGKDPAVIAGKHLELATKKTYEELKRRHVIDYQPIFRRVHLNLGESKYSNLPTDERLKKMRTETDPELVATIAQFGRYVLIAGSRPGGQPVNLKGIWNERLRPEYSSNWCIDHDAQMFYYPVETNNLSEMHGPFLQLIAELAENGKKTASTNYGMRGWCAHHNTDIWRTSSPVGNWGEGNPHWATWNMSGPWLSAHLYDHYLFSGDKEFLQEKAWPVMKGAAQFCLDWLIEDASGHLISVPSVSPENTFITNSGDTAQISVNTTSDIALTKEIFTNCISAAEVLHIEDDFVLELKNALKKIAPYRIGSKGQVLEWEEEWRPADPSHRHLSHMYPVFPGSEISPAKTPELAEAFKKALSLRARTNCTWGFSWKAACWARLGEGDSAWNTLFNQLQYVDAKSKSPINNYGLYPNLFNSDGPDLIMNGNGCATAVITEMLLQSHNGEITFLPALPEIFKDGEVKGLRARGGFEVDIRWANHQLASATIVSKTGNDCIIRTKQPVRIYAGEKEISASKVGENVYRFKTQKDEKYLIATR